MILVFFSLPEIEIEINNLCVDGRSNTIRQHIGCSVFRWYDTVRSPDSVRALQRPCQFLLFSLFDFQLLTPNKPFSQHISIREIFKLCLQQTQARAGRKREGHEALEGVPRGRLSRDPCANLPNFSKTFRLP